MFYLLLLALVSSQTHPSSAPTEAVCSRLELITGGNSMLLDLEDTQIEHNNWWMGFDSNNNEYRVYYGGSQWVVQQTQPSGAVSLLLSKETASSVPEDGVYTMDSTVDIVFEFDCHVDHACDYMLVTDVDALEEDYYQIQESTINDQYWWEGSSSSGTITYASGRWVVTESTGTEYSSAMVESDFPQGGDYQATTGDVAVKNFDFTCSTEEPETVQKVFVFEGDYASEVQDRKAEFLEKCTAELRGTCIDAYPGSIQVLVEGTETELNADEADLSDNGLDLEDFDTLYLETTTVCDTCMTSDQVESLQEMADANALLISSLQQDLETLQQGIAGWQNTLEGTEDTKQSMETCFTGYLQNRPDYVYTTTTTTTTTTTEAPFYTELSTDYICDGTGNTGGNRTFKLPYNGVEACAERCRDDVDCEYFSVREDWDICLGCAVEPSVAYSGFQTYQMLDGRRVLKDDALASLEAENEALRNALHAHMAEF